MLRHLSSIFLLLLLSSPVELRRQSSGGGSFSGRGGSASRGQVASGNNFQPAQSGGNFHPQQNNFNNAGGRPGNFQPQPNNFNNNRQPGFNQPHNNFHNSAPMAAGSKGSSHTFAKALAGGAAGALGGILIYEAGKAIIKSSSAPYSYNGHQYYWDNHYQGGPNMIQCSMPLSQLQQNVAAAEASTTSTTSTTTTAAPGAAGEIASTTAQPVVTTTPTLSNTLNTLQFQDGTRPKQIVWGCKRGVETCCGSDCCPVPVQNNAASPGVAGSQKNGVSAATIILGVIFFILLMCCCCCCIAYMMCRSMFDCVLGREKDYQETNYQQGEGAYPMQQYNDHGSQPYAHQSSYQPQQGQYQPPQGGYPPQQGYPPSNTVQYPNYPQQHAAYPNQPTY